MNVFCRPDSMIVQIAFIFQVCLNEFVFLHEIMCRFFGKRETPRDIFQTLIDLFCS